MSAEAWIWLMVGIALVCALAIFGIDRYETRAERAERERDNDPGNWGV